MSTRIFLGIPGNLAPPGSGGLSFSSDTSGGQTTLTGFTRVITSSFDLSFAHVDDWKTTEQTGQDCTYRYTFERTRDDITRQAVDPLGSAPSQHSTPLSGPRHQGYRPVTAIASSRGASASPCSQHSHTDNPALTACGGSRVFGT